MKTFKPTEEQTAILSATKLPGKSLMISALAGTGKALRDDQTVLTSNGWRFICDLRVGDKVFGIDGRPWPVKGVYPQGERELYEIRLSDGTVSIADADHIWQVYRADKRRIPQLRTTKELFAKQRSPSGTQANWGDGTRAYWFFPTCAPVRFENKQSLPLNPWLLGVLLGDGCLQERSVGFSSADKEIVEGVQNAVKSLELVVKYTAQYDYRIVTKPGAQGIPGKTGIYNPIVSIMRMLGLANTRSENKFIPKMYLYSSVDDRIALLQGLFDTDGSAGGSHIDYSTSSYELAEDVKFVVESLGGTATISPKSTTHLVSFRIYVKLPETIDGFLLERKLSRMKKGQRAPYRALMSIIPAGRAKATCISVDSPHNLYLTNGCLPTHNTTTLELIANELPKNVSLAIAFNKKIADELTRRFPPNFVIKTFNGLGHNAWGKFIGKKLTLEDRKLGKIITEVGREMRVALDNESWDLIRQLVVRAMQCGLVPTGVPSTRMLTSDTDENWNDLQELPEGVSSEVLAVARAALRRDIELARAGVISFDDQIYCSTMIGGVYAKFNTILADEAQDLNELNHLQVELSLSPSARLFICGDPLQSIYAFRGSVNGSMEKMRRLRPEDSWVDLPLATTFRCPKTVVKRQLSHAPNYKAHEGNVEGKFIQLMNGGLSATGEQLIRSDQAMPINGFSWAKLEELGNRSSIAILCRNNAPLLSLAFKLIRSGVSCQMLGRDIGKGLISLSRKLEKDDEGDILPFLSKVREWCERECTLARMNEKEHLVSGLEDRAECLIAVGENVKTVGELREKLTALFETTNARVTLATGHKAKGLEWKTVVHLDPWRIPSRYARKNPLQMQQELNLRYVIETRTKCTLIEANLEDFEL